MNSSCPSSQPSPDPARRSASVSDSKAGDGGGGGAGRSGASPGRIGVVVPLYNAATTIAETLCSLQTQTVQQWRCFIVNDGSTDAGPRVAEGFCKADQRFTLIHQTNKGLAGARNTGLEAALAAGCEYIHFLDADDWMTPHGLEWLVEAARQTGAAYGGYEMTDEHGRPLNRQLTVSAPVVGFDEELEWNRAATHARLFHRDTLGSDRFDETLPCVEDYDLWLRLERRGVRFKAVDRIVAAYRLRPASMSKDFGKMCEVFEGVVRRAVDAAREATSPGGEGTGGVEAHVDLSERRVRRVVGHTVLAHATMEALRDPSHDKAAAAEIMHAAARPERFTPAQMAQAASTAVLYGTCRGPEVDGISERRWMPPLLDWWKRCAEEGWIGADEIDECMAELSRKVVHPETVADAMLDACPRVGASGGTGGPGGRVGVVGLDKFGRRLCRHAAASGRAVVVADDFSEHAEADLLEPIERVQVVRARADMPKDLPGTWLIAPGIPADAWIALVGPGKPFPLGARRRTVLKWNDFRDRIAAAYLERLHDAVELAEPTMPKLMVG